jgi:arylsulfatase A
MFPLTCQAARAIHPNLLRHLLHKLTTLILSIVVAVLSISPLHHALYAASVRVPNIVVILADDLGYGDLTCYGSRDTKTPNIDRLAREGARFTDAYASFPVCSPTRAALLTGRYPQRFGQTYEYYFGGGSQGLDPVKHPVVASYLKAAGYATVCFGKWNVSGGQHETLGPNQFGFDYWLGFHVNHDYFTHLTPVKGAGQVGKLDFYENNKPLLRDGYTDDILTDEAVKYIGQPRDKPFFMYLAYQIPHTPLQAPDGPKDPTAVQPGTPEARGVYVKMVHRLDENVGRVLASLAQSNLESRTLVFFASDNGANKVHGCNQPLRGGKLDLYEGGIRVPFIVKWPTVVPTGTTTVMPSITLDIAATAAAAAGVEPPKEFAFDGVNLLPYLRGEKPVDAQRPLYWRWRDVRMNRGQNSLRGLAVRQGNWKFLRNYKYAGNGAFSDKYQEELYDLSADIGETTNIIKENPQIAERLKNDLAAWERMLGAPPPPAVAVRASGNTVQRRADAAAKPAGGRLLGGWVPRSCQATIEQGMLVVKGEGPVPLLGIGGLKHEGPVTLRLRARSGGGPAKVVWRTSDQKDFPASGQTAQFTLVGGHQWSEVSVELPVQGTLPQLRLYLPAQRQPVEIEWIELHPAKGEPQRWDFGKQTN